MYSNTAQGVVVIEGVQFKSRGADRAGNPKVADIFWILDGADLPPDMKFEPDRDPKKNGHYFLTVTKKMKVSTLVEHASEAETISRFIWAMADQMSEDSNNDVVVLGATDNREMLSDLEYEITLAIDNAGFIDIWNNISDEENP